MATPITYTEFVESRSIEYRESMTAIRGGTTPLLIASSRRSVIPHTSWKGVATTIKWLVTNRQDSNHSNCFHTPPTCTYKQYRNVVRSYYIEHVKVLPI